MFFTSYVLCSLRLFKLKLKDKDWNKKLHRKVTKRKLKILANPGLA